MRAIAAAALLALAGCATTSPDHGPEASLFDPGSDASAAVDAAFANARARGVNVLLVLGANWCHDSRALAGWTRTPRIETMLAERFETVFVDVGQPQTGAGRNLALAARFGFAEVTGTPLVIVAAPDGRVLNAATAQGWRNAASRSEDAIHAELAGFPLPADTR